MIPVLVAWPPRFDVLPARAALAARPRAGWAAVPVNRA